MKKVTYIMLFCLIATAFMAGCLEAKEAVPATVNQATLDDLGWTQSGEIETESITQDVGGMEAIVNTAMVTYHDERFITEMVSQIEGQLGAYGVSPEQTGDDHFTCQFITVRVALPAGISIPESVLTGIIDGQMQSMAQESNIQGFQEVSQETVTLSSGSKVTARSYEGYVESDGPELVSLKVRGILTTWSEDGYTTIVIGIIPADDIVLSIPTGIVSSGEFTIDIDVEEEYQDILTLIQNVE